MVGDPTMAKLPAFPIGFWNYCSMDMTGSEAVRDWADAGMTLAMSPEFDAQKDSASDMCAILDAAADKGLKVIVCDRRGRWDALDAGEAAFRRGFAEAVEAFGRHPAVFGFHVGDEPDTGAFENACKAVRIEREMAPDLFPFLNLLPWHPGCHYRVGYADWAGYLDACTAKARPPFLCYDCYSQCQPMPQALESQDGWEMYFYNLRQYEEAARRAGIPYWTTLLSAGHFNYRLPREDDLRWQLHTAVAHGARGILWFFLYMRTPHVNYRIPPIDEHFERTETFGWLSRVNRTFLKWQAPVFRGLSLRRVWHVGRSWAGFPSAFSRDSAIHWAKADKPLVVSEFADAGGRTYIAVVNNTVDASTQAELVVRARKPRLFRIDWGAKEVPASGEGLGRTGEDYAVAKPWLAPGQLELYRVESAPNG